MIVGMMSVDNFQLSYKTWYACDWNVIELLRRSYGEKKRVKNAINAIALYNY